MIGEKLATAAVFAVAGAVVVFALLTVAHHKEQKAECEKAGGFYFRGVFGMECSASVLPLRAKKGD